MSKNISIKNKIELLIENHKKILKNNNFIIKEIEKVIDSITSKRKQLNALIAEHFMRKIWDEFGDKRDEIITLNKEIGLIDQKINELEKKEDSQDVIQKVFNGILKYIALNEYYIDRNGKLKFKLDQEYDISLEGKRISKAQKKILSLCYFFAEIISNIKNINELKKYILIFDDPVDSADYIFFHSITSVIEHCEKILSKILKQEKIKFGQFFIFTHNSLLYDRLACSLKDYSLNQFLTKQNNISIFVKAERRINNYNIYLEEIINFYKNPKSIENKMIYIGNLIRRVLEIISSFDNLYSNDFHDLLDGMGKSKLALLVNHLSHDSFTKVLNPISHESELKEACRELFEVIYERHPYQYQTLKIKYEIDIAEQNIN